MPRFVGPSVVAGDVFGGWVVLRRDGSLALCRCRCGTTRYMQTSRLKSGRSLSCGCTGNALRAAAHRKHGEGSVDTHTKEYRAWASINHRCHCRTGKSFANYGARGIVVCEKWRRSYSAFLADVGRAPSPHHSIDRINNDGDYEPGNVRWATTAQQNRNQRRTRTVNINGADVPLVDIAGAHDIPYRTVFGRHKRGWPIDKLFVPPHKHYATTRRVAV